MVADLRRWLEEFGQNGGVRDSVEVGLDVGLGGLGVFVYFSLSRF